jgi:glutaminyl-tRNA synthetase
MASPNINLRDPAIYRIRHATHHNTGDKWCVYPMYTFAHPIEDALENITHSICTLEFEDQRPFYDWLLERLAEGGLLQRPLPQQIEFSRLNLTYVVLSKRKLIQLVEEKHVDGWDDPRMPTLVGARRRGYTPEGFRLFAERIGVSKADSLIDYVLFEDCFMREVMNESAERRVAVLDPLKLIIDNYPEGQSEDCFAPNHPLQAGTRQARCPSRANCGSRARTSWKCRARASAASSPGNKARLKYGYIVKCTGCDKDANGKVTAVHCEYLPDTKSGTPGADSVKVKGNLHWVSAAHAYAAEVRLYDRLFAVPAPGAGARAMPRSWSATSSTTSTRTRTLITAQLEPSLKDALPEERFQFERHGYFVADRVDSKAGAGVQPHGDAQGAEIGPVRRTQQPLSVLHRKVRAPPEARRRAGLHRAARVHQADRGQEAQRLAVRAGQHHPFLRNRRHPHLRRPHAELRHLPLREGAPWTGAWPMAGASPRSTAS